MNKDVIIEEVKEVLFSIVDNKVYGMDGYLFCFFKKVWFVIGNDICEVICDFFKKGKMFKKVNVVLIILIFKINIFELVEDFRFILCCRVVYKIIIKIIYERMKNVLSFLVGFE